MSRELKRNRGQRGYRPHQAQARAEKRKPKAVSRITRQVWTRVERLKKRA